LFALLSYLLVSASFVFLSLHPSCAYITGIDIDEDEAEEIAVENSIEFSSPSQSHDVINFNIFEDIARARAILEKQNAGFQVVRLKKEKKSGKGKKKKTEKREQNALGEFTILLAIEDVKTREIRVVKVHPKFGARSDNIVVEPGKSNGVNTKFTILYPEHHIVLALKRPVRQGLSFREVVYTPYSEGLDIPEVRRAGFEYLKNILARAKHDLIRKRVTPLSASSFIADDVSLTLAIIEHIDPLKFESVEFTTEKLIHETLVILGTNKENAYRYSASKAGARGLFQFIPDTYRRIARLYPRAELKRDFIPGMEDHENAAKASFLLFDADMRILSNGEKEQILSQPQALGRFLASAYNCGSAKTKGTMDRHGENWCSRVPGETQIYLKKYDAVWDWLHHQPQAIRQ
jgi:hypothetical protein